MSTVVIIEPKQHELHYWRDIWRYRDLFLMLAWRDIAVRYRQTVIGAAWALIRPFLTMLIFTIIFERLAKLPSVGTAPYSLMVFAGLLPWSFFSASLTDSANSLVGNSGLITKVYFPRLIVPIATLVVSFTDFFVSFLLLVCLMAWYHFLPGWQIVLLPFCLVLMVCVSLGPALWITSLNVRYRDVRLIIPFIVQLGLYVSPIGFSSNVVPDQWRLLYSFNPLVGVIEAFRWCILAGQSGLDPRSLVISVVVACIFLWCGLRHFRRTEAGFADLI